MKTRAEELTRYKKCKQFCYCPAPSASGYKVPCSNCREADEIAKRLFPELLSNYSVGVPNEMTCDKPTKYPITAHLLYACALPQGHDGECQPGGNCVVHGQYVGGTQCPRWPSCVTDSLQKEGSNNA